VVVETSRDIEGKIIDPRCLEGEDFGAKDSGGGNHRCGALYGGADMAHGFDIATEESCFVEIFDFVPLSSNGSGSEVISGYLYSWPDAAILA
jgi:hypothetical protein